VHAGVDARAAAETADCETLVEWLGAAARQQALMTRIPTPTRNSAIVNDLTEFAAAPHPRAPAPPLLSTTCSPYEHCRPLARFQQGDRLCLHGNSHWTVVEPRRLGDSLLRFEGPCVCGEFRPALPQSSINAVGRQVICLHRRSHWMVRRPNEIGNMLTWECPCNCRDSQANIKRATGASAMYRKPGPFTGFVCTRVDQTAREVARHRFLTGIARHFTPTTAAVPPAQTLYQPRGMSALFASGSLRGPQQPDFYASRPDAASTARPDLEQPYFHGDISRLGKRRCSWADEDTSGSDTQPAMHAKPQPPPAPGPVPQKSRKMHLKPRKLSFDHE